MANQKLLDEWGEIDELVEQVKMYVGIGLRAQVEIYEKLLNEDRFFEIKSQANYKYFEALCKAGFGRDEAIQIVAAAESSVGSAKTS